MEKNIFEGAKFGDKFMTRDGRCAVLIDTNNIFGFYFIIENDDSQKRYYSIADNGNYDNSYPEKDIVSKYQEPIDEEKLDELAKKYTTSNWFDVDNRRYCYEDGFKAGYRKAKDE